MANISEYTTVLNDAVGEITEKKSRFIAVLHHVDSEDEALDFINSVKKQHWDARHNCYAYIIGLAQPLERANDDGEPSRTAGVPILEAVKSAGLTNVCVVVTRYFGGILLGTGPLARAYRDAATEAVKAAEFVKMRLMRNITFTTDYDSYGKLRYEADRLSLKILDTEFLEKVTVFMALDDDSFRHMNAFVADISKGNATMADTGDIWIRE